MARGSIRAGIRSRAWLLLAIPGLLFSVKAGAQRPVWADHPYVTPQRMAEWVPSPGSWEPLESVVVVDPQGECWRVLSERRLLGGLRDRAVDLPVYLPRVVFGRIHGGDTSAVAVLLPSDNASVKIYPPNDPEVSAVPSAGTDDTWGRWPNPCTFSIIDATGKLDLEADGRIEVAIGRMCSCSSVACSGTVFVTLGPDGASVLDPADLVHDVRLGRVSVREMIATADSSRPILRVDPEILDQCRFIALAGVRGKNDCAGCCSFPVMLRPIIGGEYETFYDYKRQEIWKNRSNDHVSFVVSGDPLSPPTSDEEAQLAQAAAFFYLTGSGGRSHSEIDKALGDRARDYHIQEILNRLDRVFLPDSTSMPVKPERPVRPAAPKKPESPPARPRTPGEAGGPPRQGNG
jgi:hypothetical protein